MFWIMLIFGASTYASCHFGLPIAALISSLLGMAWSHWLGLGRGMMDAYDEVGRRQWRPSGEPTPRLARRVINEECD